METNKARITKDLKETIGQAYRAALINKDSRNLQRVKLASHVAMAMFDEGFTPNQADCVNAAIDTCVAIKESVEAMFCVLRTLGFDIEGD